MCIMTESLRIVKWLLPVPGISELNLTNVIEQCIPIIKESSFEQGLDGNWPKTDDYEHELLISSAIRLNLSSLSGQNVKIFAGEAL